MIASGKISSQVSAVSAESVVETGDPAAREAQLLLAAGKKHYTTSCVLCHGKQGEGNAGLAAPALSPLDADYTVRQLINFKEGRRGAHVEDPEGARMRTIAMTLPEEASVEAVSSYIESLKSPPPPTTIEANIDTGKARYALCASCHGAGQKVTRHSKRLGWRAFRIGI